MSAPAKAVSAAARGYPRGLPTLMLGAGGLGAAAYIRRQLVTESNTMDRFFSSYNTPESEASRRKTFEGQPDPRTNLLNFLSWKK